MNEGILPNKLYATDVCIPNPQPSTNKLFIFGWVFNLQEKPKVKYWLELKITKYAHALLPFRMKFSALFKGNPFKEHVICILSLFCSSFENKENRKLLYFYAYATFTISSEISSFSRFI